ncbi:RNA-directed DNA polymerase, eukaryota [Tanacetum coccineum]
MGIDDWHVVSRKKHGYRSYEDDVAKISISIYVSNLPETFSAKDLFHACNKYGHVVDSFIPLKRSRKPPLMAGTIRNSKSDDRTFRTPYCAWNNKASPKLCLLGYFDLLLDVVRIVRCRYRKVCVTCQESSFMNENIENVINEQEPPQDKISEDPFGIYNILNKQDNKEAGQDSDPFYPHGFTQEEEFFVCGIPNSFVKDNATISDYICGGSWYWALHVLRLSSEIKQKVSWGFEGDEMKFSKFFLGLLLERSSTLLLVVFSIDGDWIDDPMQVFGIKWRGWIHGCLLSGYGNIVLSNGCNLVRAAEFKFNKGLKQGYPDLMIRCDISSFYAVRHSSLANGS